MKIAAVVVTFNRKEYLVKNIEALLAQVNAPMDILIIDNASTDGTEETIRHYMDAGQILYENTGENLGGDTFRDTSTPRRALPRLSGRYPSDLIMEAGLLGADVTRFYYCPKASGADRPDVDATLMVPTDRTRWTAHAERLGLDPNAEDYPDMLLDRDAMAVCRPVGTVRLAHPTVKPSDLMRWLVRLACPAGGLVLDPFLGSGSTLSAARAEGLRCVGTELDTHYMPLIRERMAEPAGQPLF